MNINIDKFLNIYGISGIALIGLIALGTGINSPTTNPDAPETLENVDGTVYKSPSCGCCGAWAQYAERQGMNIEVKEVRNLGQIKDRENVPSELGSCHTTVLDDYVVEGHVPAEAIEKLLREESDVYGIGLPGMPQGSPGMPGPKTGEWTISSFTESGEIQTFITV